MQRSRQQLLIAAGLIWSVLPDPVAAQLGGGQAAQSPPPTGSATPSAATKYFDASAGTSVEQLVEQALARNAELLATRQRRTEAQGLLRQAGFRPNPGFETTFTSGPALGNPGEGGFSVSYSHIFELGGKRQRRVEVAERGAELAELEIADQERQLRAQLRTRFGEALASIRNLQFAESLLGLTGQTYQLTVARVKEGESPKLEQGLLQVELNRLNSDRTLLENQVLRAVLEIKPLAGMGLDEPLRLRGDLRPAAIKLALAEALERASRERPDLRAARVQEVLAEAEVRAARAEAVPNLIASGGYTRTYSAFDQLGFTPGGAPAALRDKDNLATVGLSITLPTRNRNQGLIQAAVARQNASRLRRQFLEQIVARETRSAMSRYEAAREALAIFDQQVLDSAQDNLRIIRAAYSAGELRVFDVVNEQRRLVDTQRAYTDVLREYYLSVVELERAIGGPVR